MDLFLLGVSECRCKFFGIEAITFCSHVRISTYYNIWRKLGLSVGIPKKLVKKRIGQVALALRCILPDGHQRWGILQDLFANCNFVYSTNCILSIPWPQHLRSYSAGGHLLPRCIFRSQISCWFTKTNFFSLELENNLAYDGTVTITTMADLAAAKNFISTYLTYCGKSSSQQNIPDAMQFAKALPRLIVRPSLERE